MVKQLRGITIRHASLPVMHFSELIRALKERNAGVLSYGLGTDPEIINGASLDQAQDTQIGFLEKGNALTASLSESDVGAIIIPNIEELRLKAEKKSIAWAVASDPRLAFAEILELLNPRPVPQKGVHPSAVIENEVTLGEDISIGANVFIGKKVQIGSKTIIHPGVVIYENVVIGESTEIHANAVIHPNCHLGKQCVINSNAVIGSEGFGFVPTPSGWRKMPQTGKVILESEVEIGSCSTIDRPCVGQTLIGTGTKVDNLVQIGHGVITGKGCAIASQVGIAGGAILGEGVILAGQVGVANRAKIGDRAIASSKSGIHGSIAPGEVVSGYPAIPNRLWLRCSAAFSKLPEITRSLRELKKEGSE